MEREMTIQQIQPSDLKKEWLLINREGDENNHTACLMSARSLLDGRGLTDSYPSRVIRMFGISINDSDWWFGDIDRTRHLMPVALDERMCAKTVDYSKAAERVRVRMIANVAVRKWAPAFMKLLGREDLEEALSSMGPIDTSQPSAALKLIGRLFKAEGGETTSGVLSVLAHCRYVISAGFDGYGSSHAVGIAVRWHRLVPNKREGDSPARQAAIDLLLELCEVQASGNKEKV
jgi:hypothetical protein